MTVVRRHLVLLVLAAGLLVTLGVASNLLSARTVAADERLDMDANRATRLLIDELGRYIDLTAVLGEVVRERPDLNLDAWREFIATADAEGRYEAAAGFSFLTRVEPADRDTFLASAQERVPGFALRTTSTNPEDILRPITLIAPLEPNASALGFDVTSNPSAERAASLAATRGRPIATRPITLVQESGDQIGLVVYNPVQSAPRLANDASTDAVIGWSSVIFRGDDFLAGVFDNAGLQLEVSFSDAEVGSSQDPEALIGHWPATAAPAPPDAARSIELYGRRWTISMTQTNPPNILRDPIAALLGGLLTTGLLALVVASQRRAEERALELADDLTAELRGSEANLVVLNEDLEDRNQELMRFTYIASHDLQEPLRMVASFLALLQDHLGADIDEDAQTYIDFAVDGSTRMHHLINDLLVLSRVGRVAPTRETVDVTRAAAETMTDLASLVEEHGAVVAIGHTDDVVADPTMLGQLLQNVIGNAVKFHHPDRPPVVAVDASLSGGVWTLQVVDHGIGIEPEFRERAFEAFRRLQGREFEGTGIGLSVCDRIVRAHDGTIEVQTTPGGGTTMIVRLPQGEPPATG